MRQALEKDRPTLTYNCKPYQNPKTRPLEPEKGKLATKSLEGPLNKINHNKIPPKSKKRAFERLISNEQYRMEN